MFAGKLAMVCSIYEMRLLAWIMADLRVYGYM